MDDDEDDEEHLPNYKRQKGSIEQNEAEEEHEADELKQINSAVTFNQEKPEEIEQQRN